MVLRHIGFLLQGTDAVTDSVKYVPLFNPEGFMALVPGDSTTIQQVLDKLGLQRAEVPESVSVNTLFPTNCHYRDSGAVFLIRRAGTEPLGLPDGRNLRDLFAIITPHQDTLCLTMRYGDEN